MTLFFPQEWGIKGVEGEPLSALLGNTPSIANSEDKALDCARLLIDASSGMMIGRTH